MAEQDPVVVPMLAYEDGVGVPPVSTSKSHYPHADCGTQSL
jgi:hypothetical protein